LADSDADDTRLLYRLTNKDFFLFDSSADVNIQYFSLENFSYSDQALLSKTPGQLIVVQKGDIRRVSQSDMQGELMTSQASKVRTGKKFPFVAYLHNQTAVVVKNLLTGEERRWENATLQSIEESCHSLFIRQEKEKIFTILDLRNFKSLDYDRGNATCLGQSGQLVVEDGKSETSSYLLDSNYSVLTTLPGKPYSVWANKQGVFFGQSNEGKEFLSYAFDGSFLGKISSDRSLSRSQSALDHFNIFSYDKMMDSEYPNQSRYEIYDRNLKLLGTTTQHDELKPSLRWELLGPVLWNQATDEVFELSDPVTGEKLLEYIPVPNWDGIRFYPTDNGKLFDVLKGWTKSGS
jgi:hypothetical protein